MNESDIPLTVEQEAWAKRLAQLLSRITAWTTEQEALAVEDAYHRIQQEKWQRGMPRRDRFPSLRKLGARMGMDEGKLNAALNRANRAMDHDER